MLIALTDLAKGDTVNFSGANFELVSEVPAKHKFVTTDLAQGDRVIMYGVVVGKAAEPLRRGQALTTRNLRHDTSAVEEKSPDFHWTPPDISNFQQRTFSGYVRPDGQVGTRNHWLVVPLVFCENRNIATLKQAFEEELGFAPPPVYRQQVADLARLFRERKFGEIESYQAQEARPQRRTSTLFKNVDGIKFLIHEGGCGGTREDSNNLCALIAGYLHHPNVAGATVFSLGCQHSQVAVLREELKKRDPHFKKPLFVFEQQQSGTEFTMLSQAIRKTFEGLVEADKSERSPIAHFAPLRRPKMRRLRRFFRNFRESRDRPHLRSPRSLGRPHDPFRISRTLRRGAGTRSTAAPQSKSPTASSISCAPTTREPKPCFRASR